MLSQVTQNTSSTTSLTTVKVAKGKGREEMAKRPAVKCLSLWLLGYCEDPLLLSRQGRCFFLKKALMPRPYEQTVTIERCCFLLLGCLSPAKSHALQTWKPLLSRLRGETDYSHSGRVSTGPPVKGLSVRNLEANFLGHRSFLTFSAAPEHLEVILSIS